MNDHTKEFRGAINQANSAFTRAVYTAKTEGMRDGWMSERERVRELVANRMHKAAGKKEGAVALAMSDLLKGIDGQNKGLDATWKPCALCVASGASGCSQCCADPQQERLEG